MSKGSYTKSYTRSKPSKPTGDSDQLSEPRPKFIVFWRLKFRCTERERVFFRSNDVQRGSWLLALLRTVPFMFHAYLSIVLEFVLLINSWRMFYVFEAP